MSDAHSAPLKREIGPLGAVMLVMGGIIGSGIFKNPAVVARSLHAPGEIIAAWVIGGVVAMLGAFVYAEMAERMPETGGEYAYLRDTYGPLTGFLYGWTTLLVVQTGGMAAVAIIFATYVLKLTGGGLDPRILAVGVLAALALANCLGVKAGDRVQTWLGLLKIVAIAGLVICGLFLVAAPHPLTPISSGPPTTGWLKAFGAALIPVLFAYGGWQTANYVAGEIKDPRRNLAIALIVGVGGVIVLYVAVNLACLRALGPTTLAASETPAAMVMQLVVGPVGARLASLAIALSALGYLSQAMLTGPRVYYAMARDGLFFRRIAQVSDSTRAPAASILLQAAWTAVLALSGTYEQILSYVVSINFLFFGITASCLFLLRRRDRAAAAPDAQGFRAPWHPLTTGLFIAACAVVVGSSFWAYPVNSLIGYGILLLGVPAYLYWRRTARPAP